MTKHAVAYIRRSVARTGDPGDISREFQTEKVRALAGDGAASLQIVDADWGISAAREKTHRRLAFLAMLGAIERGDVSTLYAYSADRLARSVRWAAQLLDACEDAGTTIVTTEGRFPPGDSAARMLFQMLAVMNENAVRGMAEKARSTYAARKARGGHAGRVPYGWRLTRNAEGVSVLERDPAQPIQPLIDAYTQAKGRVRTAVRILNDDVRLPAPRGGEWDRPTLLRILQREAPDLLPRLTASGRRDADASPAMFAKLLRCHCGRLLTPNRHVERRRSDETVAVSYYCSRGNATPGEHGRPYYVAESVVRPFTEEQAARYMPDAVVTLTDVDAPRRRALLDRRTRLLDLYEMGTFDAVELARRVAAIDADLATLGARTDSIARIAIPGAIDWDGDPGEVNRALRSIFTAIDLDRSLRPVSVDWAVPPEYYDLDARAAYEAQIAEVA